MKGLPKAFRALEYFLTLDMGLRQHEASKNELNRVDDEICNIRHVSLDESPKNNLETDGTDHGGVHRRPTESQPAFSPTIPGWQLKIIVFSYV